MCFFATDIHSATLGKGKSDDTLIRVRNGDLKGKAELVVCLFNSFRVYMGLLSQTNPRLKMIFGKQDTHVPREGRDLIRKTLEDADVPVSVSV